jgi:demethylmacrocin O-methyltransferase
MLGGIVLMSNLDHLGRWYGTDKASSAHGYTTLYQRHLRHRRLDKLSILEIGVGGRETNTGGPSLRMWRSFFPRASVVGIDLYEKDLPREARITVLRGDQTDLRFLADLVSRHGPFDLVIDDGSHRGGDINTTFTALWPHVRSKGLYVIEDLSTAYDSDYGGGPPGAENTSVALLKALLDAVQEKGDRRASAVHVYQDIAFIEK